MWWVILVSEVKKEYDKRETIKQRDWEKQKKILNKMCRTSSS